MVVEVELVRGYGKRGAKLRDEATLKRASLLTILTRSSSLQSCVVVEIRCVSSGIVNRSVANGWSYLLRNDRPILIILMPLKPLILINHQQISTNPNLITPPHLPKHIPNRRMIIKVSKSLIRLPYIPLNVIIKLASGTRKRPEVGLLGLAHCGFSHVADPVFVEDGV